MKLRHNLPFKTIQAMLLLLTAVSCSRQPDEVWDDTKSCGRHITRGFRTLAGGDPTSRQIYNKDDFISWEEPSYYEIAEGDFQTIPGNEAVMANAMNQPRETPGDVHSSIPGISAFRDPASASSTRNVFRNIYFGYNSNLVKGQDNTETLQSIASYMRSNPNTYVFIEGHCDERGPQAYNLALGTRRSNAVRDALIQQGINGDHLFTISYGAERPLVMESNEDAWSKNRRAEFKIYQP